MSEAVEEIIENKMFFNETVFGFRSSEKIMSVISQENFTAFILTREFYSKKACITYFFQKEIVSPICNSRMAECPVYLKVPEQKNQMSLTLAVTYPPQFIDINFQLPCINFKNISLIDEVYIQK